MAVSKSYANRVELREGAVVLYQKPGGKRGFWYYRIQVRGMRDIGGAKIKYDERSTGETDLDEAKRVALERHDDLKLRVRAKQPVKSITFADLYELWWAYKKQKLNSNHIAKGRSGVTTRIGWLEKHSKRYWLPYFGKHKLEELTQHIVEGYWSWRMAYWHNATQDERDDFPNHALSPAKKSLEMEQSSLSEIFKWGNSMKLFSFQPIISNPYSRMGIPPARRPSFDPDEWTKLSQYLDRWVDGNGKHDKAKGSRLNSRHLYHRKLLRLYVHFIVATGMRPGEVLKIRQRDMVWEETPQNKLRHLVVKVPRDTKTGARSVVGEPHLPRIYGELHQLTKRGDEDDWLFCDAKGKQSIGFGKTLQTVLADCDLLTDEHGKRRSAYSFRHYYAERKFDELNFNPRAFDLIGTNMGTSRQMLEAHYVRKGIINDQETFLGLSPLKAKTVKQRSTGKLKAVIARPIPKPKP